MYNASSIKSGLIGLVGWRQNEDSTGTQLTSLTSSTSGLYFNDEHPMLTPDNLLSIAPEYVRLDSYTAWNSGTTYAAGARVSQGGTNYVALQSSTNQDPAATTGYWDNLFTYWLRTKTEAGIIRGLNAWIDRKFTQRTAKNLLEDTKLFEATGLITEKDTNAGLVAGLEILPMRSKNLLIKINKIGLQFDTDQTITVYLFNSRQPSPIQTQAISYTGSSGIQWHTLTTPWELEGEGAYYLVYDQGAISGQSINGVHNYAYLHGGRTSFPNGQFFRTAAFSVDGTVAGLWNASSNAYTIETNYGLNLDMSVECDYTNLFLEQKNEFKNVISKQVAVDLLREMAFNANTRVNRNQMNADTVQLLYEIDGDTQGRDPGNMKKQLDDAINSASMDMTSIDKVCLPCRRRASKWRVA